MLLLTRRDGESIRIGDDIMVTVLNVNGNQVKIGIDAPRDVEIMREELYYQEPDENAARESRPRYQLRGFYYVQ